MPFRRAERRILGVQLILLVLLTVVRVVLACNTPVVCYLASAEDDGLFANQALSLLSGNWLGTYGALTLAKNPGYSFMLAFCGASGLPYQLVFIMLQVVASFAFSQALRPVIPSRWVRLAIYVGLLYSSLLFTAAFFKRVYRDGMVIPFAILSLSGFIAMYLRRECPWKKLLPWAVFGGGSLSILAIIKENALWIAPFVGVCSLVILVGWIVRAKKGDISRPEALRKSLVLALSLLLSCVLTAGLSAANQSKYGTAVTNERFQGNFARVCSDLSKIDSGADARIWVSRSSLESALMQSETLRSIETPLRAAWDQRAMDAGGTEIYGDMAYWALMDGYEGSGGYQDGPTTQEFWGQVADELDAGFDDGSLIKKQGLAISSVSPPIGDIGSWLSLTLRSCARLVTFNTMDSRLITEDWEPETSLAVSLDEELEVRDMLGGNTLLNVEGVDDSTAEDHALADELDRYLGHVSVLLMRVCTVSLAPAAVVLALLEVKRRKRGIGGHGVETTLIVAGLLLSAFIFEAAVTWYVSSELSVFLLESSALEQYKYSPEFYVLLSLAAFVVLGRLATVVSEERREKKTGLISPKEEKDDGSINAKS